MDDFTGYLRLVMERKEEKSGVKDSYFQGALKMTRPLQLDDSGEACIYIMNPGGGYLDGDHYQLDIQLEPEAELVLTTQSSTKIYKTIHQPAIQEMHVVLKEGSVLEYIPDSTIGYEHARFYQDTVVHMERGATLFYTDLVTPGWAPDGSLFAYGKIQSKLQVYMGKTCVLYDHVKLEPDKDIQFLGMFEGYSHYGSLIAISEKFTPEFLEQIHEAVESMETAALFGMSRLPISGFSCRVLANQTQEIQQIFSKCHDMIREQWLNKKPIFLRKY